MFLRGLRVKRMEVQMTIVLWGVIASVRMVAPLVAAAVTVVPSSLGFRLLSRE